MSSFLLLVRSVSPGLYILGGIGIFFGLRAFLSSTRQLTYAQFPLERETAEQVGGWGISLIIISIEFVILIWLVSNITYDSWVNLETDSEENTVVQQDRFDTQTPSFGGDSFQEPTQAIDSGIVPFRTQPPSPTPAATLRPADEPDGCILEQAFINIPDNGQVIFQTESIIGTANIENFGYYRFEIRNVETQDQFGVIGGASSDYPNPIQNGPLGSIIPQNYLPGEYRFRLIVFDTGGLARAWCEITLFISDPLPTPTPVGGGVAPGIGIPAPTTAP